MDVRRISTYHVKSRDSLLIHLWLLSFRALSLGVVVLGVIAAVGGTVTALVAVLPRMQSSPGLKFSTGVLFAIVGVTFVWIGVRGYKIRTRRDLDADISTTPGNRDSLERWINR